MSNSVQLTPHQQQATDAIQAFLVGPENCFVLQGSAGTGKTTLLAALAGRLDAANRPYRFLAPTGRAARILGDKTGADSATIHRQIYALDRLQVFEQARTKNDPGMRFHFALRTEDPGDILFVIDEASMVGDREDKQDLLRFGSGRLLADLIAYMRVGRPGRHGSDPGAKLLFVGDPAQLPPIGEIQSPALTADYLEDTFGLRCTGFELTEVLRQASGSAILERATALRDAIKARRFNTFDLKPSRGEVLCEEIPESVSRVAEDYNRRNASSVLITYTNRRALELNQAVRERLWGNELAELRMGDQLLVNRNNRHSGLYNGDLVRVVSVATEPERRRVRMKGVEPVELSFRTATVTYKDARRNIRRIECRLLENLLDSRERDLSPLQQRALLVDFRQRYPKLRPSTREFTMTIRDDPWFNALQVKYGYALTCHKAQGGEWDTAVVSFESGRGVRNEEFFRWAYTAITRAKHTLVTVGAPSVDAYSDMDWSETSIAPATDSGEPAHASDPDWDRFSFSEQHATIFEHHRRLREALRLHGIAVDTLEHLQYCERYGLRCDGRFARIQYWYKGNGRVSRIAPVSGNGSGDPALVESSIAILREALLSAPETGDDAHGAFVHALIQRLEQAVAGTGVHLVSTQRMQYRLRVELDDGRRRGKLDFHHDGTPKWTKVEEVGGQGASHGLVDWVCPLLTERRT